ncbi:MAG: Asp-tRNA(Asn)/Glu-tRNA(Gln) amidotransferase subunit GatB, partial [Acidimicrobiia bacterium]
RESKRPTQIVEERGLAQVSDAGALGTLVDDVFAANADAVDDWRTGDDKVKKKKRGFLMGEVMKASKGSADPKVLNRLLDEKLSG